MAYSVDFHVHSNKSLDGRSGLEDLLQEAKAVSLQAIALCDHNHIYHPSEWGTLSQEVLVIPGCEFSTDCGHILGLFLETGERNPETLAEDMAELFLGERVAPIIKVLAYIAELQGIAVVAHPYAKERESYDFVEGLFGVEVVNPRAQYKNPQAMTQAKALAETRGKVFFGGSDAHSAKEVGKAYTEVGASSCSLEELKQGVLLGDTKVIFTGNTKRVEKAKSQWVKAKKTGGSPLLFLRCGIYYLYSVLWDVCHRE